MEWQEEALAPNGFSAPSVGNTIIFDTAEAADLNEISDQLV